MKFWRAIGLGVGLIVIRILMPEVFEGLKDTLLAFFSTLSDMLAFSTEALQQGQTAMVYPHVPPVH